MTNPIIIFAIVLSCIVVVVTFYNFIPSEKPIEGGKFQGPVPENSDEKHFRSTGITRQKEVVS